jgi:hypothetical protein
LGPVGVAHFAAAVFSHFFNAGGCLRIGRVSRKPFLESCRVLVRFLISVTVAIAFPALAQEYEIRLHRPEPVGSKTRVTGSGRDVQQMSVWSAKRKAREDASDVTIDFEYVRKVVVVSPKGVPTHVLLQFERLKTTKGKTTRDVLPRNAEVLAFNSGNKPSFHMNGVAVKPEVAHMLTLIAPVSTGDFTNDELFGTQDRKRVGDSWDVNGRAWSQMMTYHNGKVRDIKGRVTLKEVLKHAADSRLSLALEMAGTMETGPGAFPPLAAMTYKATMEVPIEPNAKGAGTLEATVTGRGFQKVADGTEFEGHIDMKCSVSFEMSPAE